MSYIYYNKNNDDLIKRLVAKIHLKFVYNKLKVVNNVHYFETK